MTKKLESIIISVLRMNKPDKISQEKLFAEARKKGYGGTRGKLIEVAYQNPQVVSFRPLIGGSHDKHSNVYYFQLPGMRGCTGY